MALLLLFHLPSDNVQRLLKSYTPSIRETIDIIQWLGTGIWYEPIRPEHCHGTLSTASLSTSSNSIQLPGALYFVRIMTCGIHRYSSLPQQTFQHSLLPRLDSINPRLLLDRDIVLLEQHSTIVGHAIPHPDFVFFFVFWQKIAPLPLLS